MKPCKGIKRDPRGSNRFVATIADPFSSRKRQFYFDTEGEAIAKKLETLAKIKAVQQGHLIVPENVVDTVRWLVKNGKEGFADTVASDSPLTKPTTLLDVVDAYLLRQKERADAGGQAGISAGRYNVEAFHLGVFREFCEGHKATNLAVAFSAEKLESFKLYASKRFPSAYTLREATYCVKALIMWAWESRKIEELPRNLKTFRHVSVPDPTPAVFNKDEVATMFNRASTRTKLYILLALNAGYTQKDIADLRHINVDWKAGIIDEVRGKVIKKATVPRIVKLWPSTLQLLKTEATHPDIHERVLVSADGDVLAYRTTRNGKPRVVDCVHRAYERLRTKCALKDRTFKDFRKTGADLIQNSYVPQGPTTKTNQQLFKMYLAHKPPRVDMHYDPGDWKELHTSTDWLGHFLGLYDGGKVEGSA